MTVTIELKPETEKRLAKEADKKGLPIETFIEVFIQENLSKEKEEIEKSFHKTTNEEWRTEFHRWLDSRKDRGEPYLSDEATRRENIYEDRF